MYISTYQNISPDIICCFARVAEVMRDYIYYFKSVRIYLKIYSNATLTVSSNHTALRVGIEYLRISRLATKYVLDPYNLPFEDVLRIFHGVHILFGTHVPFLRLKY